MKQEEKAPSVCLCLCTHVNDHLSRLEKIMRPEQPLLQGYMLHALSLQKHSADCWHGGSEPHSQRFFSLLLHFTPSFLISVREAAMMFVFGGFFFFIQTWENDVSQSLFPPPEFFTC
ncbi:hypothetical protein XENOCAPTIV_001248 [Xenoophorus captivus]|uniref:Uncharacterized protein n=1 Tax=Xenoophorus captivus TaxID=1517983 RepID=A0ABV0S1A1_9TELE